MLSAELERRRSARCGRVASRGLCSDGVDLGEPDVGAIEAVCLVDYGEAGVVVFDKGDINARVEGGAVYSELDNLDGSIVAGLDAGIDREWHLGQADSARVGVLRGADDAKLRNHGVGHVWGAAVRAIGAKSEVDENLCRSVALEPARLERNGTAGHGPVGTVGRGFHTATRIHPLHAVGECLVGDQIVASPSGVDHDGVSRSQGGTGCGEEYRGKHRVI